MPPSTTLKANSQTKGRNVHPMQMPGRPVDGALHDGLTRGDQGELRNKGPRNHHQGTAERSTPTSLRAYHEATDDANNY